GISGLVTEAFSHIETLGPRVAEGRYDLVNPEGETILPSVWHAVVRPGLEVTMTFWPAPVEEPPADCMAPVPEGGTGPSSMKAATVDHSDDDDDMEELHLYEDLSKVDEAKSTVVSQSSDDESEEGVADEAMDEEEAERVVKELLRKYTTLEAVPENPKTALGIGTP
ncbi:MAG: hypothetical protein Q9181_002540, partial [Wetmoreana brouardii]